MSTVYIKNPLKYTPGFQPVSGPRLENYSAMMEQCPEDRLHLFFSTHDVTLTGWRLRPLVNMVRAGTLASVRSLDTRYAQVNTKHPFIARIKIAPVKEG